MSCLSRATILLVATTSLVGCGGLDSRKKDKISRSDIKSYFVHGDPMKLIEGTQRSEKPVIEIAKIDRFNHFKITGLGTYNSKSEIVSNGPQSQSEIEAENDVHRKLGEEQKEEEEEAKGGEVSNDFEFVQQADGSYWYCSIDGCKGIYLKFRPEGEGLRLQGIASSEDEGGDVTFPVRILHESIRADGSAFSLLAETSTPDEGVSLLTIYFTQGGNEPAQLADVDKKYAYLGGRGMPTPWMGEQEDDIKIDLCGSMSAKEEETLRNGVMAWAKGGRIGKRKLVLQKPEVTRPFSDVEQHCLGIVDNYFFDETDQTITLGVTLPVILKESRRILDSDIFIAKAGFRKGYGSDEIDQQTVIHEVGHFLGLHHEFERDMDTGLPLYRSIMSYENNIYNIATHDIEAIEQMYGSYPSEGTFGSM